MKFLHLILLCFAFFPTFSQAQLFAFLKGMEKVEIPFEYDGKFILVTGRINGGIPLNFIVDTGAENLILLKKSIAEMHGLTYSHEIPILGSDLRVREMAWVSPSVEIDLGQKNIVHHPFVVLQKDLFISDHYMGKRIDGIIGASLFYHFKVHFDFDKRTLELYPSSAVTKYENHGEYDSIPMDVISRRPHLRFESKYKGRDTSFNLMMDTGAGLRYLLLEDKKQIKKDSSTLVYGILGRSINGPVLGYYGEMEKLSCGPFQTEESIVSFQSIDSINIPLHELDRHGLIGLGVLDNYNFLLDYRGEALFVKKRKRARRERKRKNRHYDRSGLSLTARGDRLNRIVVEYVVNNSPASKGGIAVGDEILAVNGLPTWLIDFQRLNWKLKAKAGKRIKLKFLRNGEKMKKSFVLRDKF